MFGRVQKAKACNTHAQARGFRSYVCRTSFLPQFTGSLDVKCRCCPPLPSQRHDFDMTPPNRFFKGRSTDGSSSCCFCPPLCHFDVAIPRRFFQIAAHLFHVVIAILHAIATAVAWDIRKAQILGRIVWCQEETTQANEEEYQSVDESFKSFSPLVRHDCSLFVYLLESIRRISLSSTSRWFRLQ